MAHRVLIIEDDADLADALRETIEIRGHAARLARSGEDALAAAHDFQPDLVLCDIGLPGMDGLATARALRAASSCAGARLVALSGDAKPASLAGASTGFDAWIVKPIHSESLEQILGPA